MKNINIEQLIGKEGTNYNNDYGKIVAACLVRDFEKLNSYDISGWMSESAFHEYGLEQNDVLVAFETIGGMTAVYTFGGGGVTINAQNETA